MYLRLSHTLDSEIPTYKRADGFSSKPGMSMSKGDFANTNYFTMMNHVGTHIEAPHHFLNNMKTIDSFDISAFVFEKPTLIDIPKGDAELIDRSDLMKARDKISGKDIILIRTGFGDLQSNDRQRYEFSGPGFSAEAAGYLQEFRDLRALGIDFISLNSPKFEEDGYRAHRILLSKEVRSGFFIIEDMDLRQDFKSLKRLIVAPLYVKGFDSVPCTVIAETLE